MAFSKHSQVNKVGKAFTELADRQSRCCVDNFQKVWTPSIRVHDIGHSCNFAQKLKFRQLLPYCGVQELSICIILNARPKLSGPRVNIIRMYNIVSNTRAAATLCSLANVRT